MRLTEAFLRGWGRESFDELDAFLLRAAGGALPPAPAITPEELYDRAERRRVVHLLHGDGGSDGFPGLDLTRRFAAVTAARQLDAWREIDAAFGAAGITVAGNKGPFLGALLDRPAGRTPVTTDLDLLVEEKSVDGAVAVLESLGYIRGLNIQDHAFVRMSSRSVRDLEAEQGSFGQLAPFCRLLRLPELDDVADDLLRWLPNRKVVRTAAGIRSMLSVDLHFDLGHRDASGAEHPVPAADLIAGAITVDHDGTPLRTLDTPTMTWLLCYRAYLDTAVFGELRFKPFADAAELIRHGGWRREAFDAAAARYPHIAEPVAETLRFLAEECGVDLDVPHVVAPTAPAPRRTATFLLVCHGWGSAVRSSPWVRELRSQLDGAEVVVEECAPFEDTDDPTPLGAATAALRERAAALREENPGAALGFVGISLGSTVALSAATTGTPPDFLVAVSPVLDAGIDGTDADGRVRFLGTTVGPAFADDLVICSPGHDLDPPECPVLVLHGGQDNERRTRDALALAARAEAHGSARQEFPAGTHTLDNTPVGAAAAVSSWLAGLGRVTFPSTRS